MKSPLGFVGTEFERAAFEDETAPGRAKRHVSGGRSNSTGRGRRSGTLAAVKLSVVDRVDGTVGADRRWRVGLSGGRGHRERRRQRVAGEVPPVNMSVLTVHYGALVGRVY